MGSSDHSVTTSIKPSFAQTIPEIQTSRRYVSRQANNQYPPKGGETHLQVTILSN